MITAFSTSLSPVFPKYPIFFINCNCKREDRNILRARENKVCCNIVSPDNVRNFIHEASPTWLSKHDLSKDGHNRQANKDEGILTGSQPQTKD